MINPAAAAAATTAGAGAVLAVGGRRWYRELQDRTAARLAASGALAADLAAVGSDAAAFVSAAAGRAAAAVAIGVVAAAAAWPAVGPPAVAVVVAAGAGVVLRQKRRLAAQAAKARNELRSAGLELAELVSLGIGGGLGVPAALATAAGLLDGAGGRRLAATAVGPQPWDALEDLGEQTGVAELADLGRTLAVGVAAQARTREVLLSWAQAARAARLEQGEASAAAATEAMTGPLALVAFGFLLVVGVPAVLELLSGVTAVHL